MLDVGNMHGVFVALASPLKHDATADEGGVHRLVEHALAGGVRGLLPLGSTGETASLDEPTRRAILRATVEAADRRVPVICGVAQSHLTAACAEVAAAAQLGADAALVAPPFYYPLEQSTLIAFYRQVAEGSPIPILLYNIPQFTKVVAEPATVATLAREGVIKGIKDSSRDFEYFEGVCIATRELPSFRVFTGSDTMLLASLTMGGAGTICASANVAPTWVVRIYEQFVRGDLAAAREAQNELYQLVVVLRSGRFGAGIKAALNMQGICEPWSAPPVEKLEDRLAVKLRDQLAAWKLLPD